jgi:thiamine monophosphate kinase
MVNWSQFILHKGDDFILLFTAGESVSALSTAFGRIMKIKVMRLALYPVDSK